MAVTSRRSIKIDFTEDLSSDLEFSAAVNTDAPGEMEIYSLASGPNTITVPDGGTVRAATIIPPTGNATSITLKGVTGDTGVPLHVTDPTSIALASGTVDFVLTAGAVISGVRIIWT